MVKRRSSSLSLSAWRSRQSCAWTSSRSSVGSVDESSAASRQDAARRMRGRRNVARSSVPNAAPCTPAPPAGSVEVTCLSSGVGRKSSAFGLERRYCSGPRIEADRIDTVSVGPVVAAALHQLSVPCTSAVGLTVAAVLALFLREAVHPPAEHDPDEARPVREHRPTRIRVVVRRVWSHDRVAGRNGEHLPARPRELVRTRAATWTRLTLDWTSIRPCRRSFVA